MTPYLADTSAWHRSGRPPVIDRWQELLLRGQLASCSPIRLELLFSARGAADYKSLRDDLRALPDLPLSAQVVARAEDVQAGLAARGQHRGPTPVDVYVAAVAELNAATLLHYDRHFDAIARVTDQQMEWIAPRGSLD